MSGISSKPQVDRPGCSWHPGARGRGRGHEEPRPSTSRAAYAGSGRAMPSGRGPVNTSSGNTGEDDDSLDYYQRLARDNPIDNRTGREYSTN